jgi:glycosyltransferase 2 family protein
LKPLIELAGDWRRLAGMAFVAAALVFLGGFLFTNLRELQAHDWTIRPALLTLSVVIQVIGLASGALAWQLLLRGMGTHIPFLPLARVRFFSGLARYIPGKIWPFLGAARLAAGFDIPAAVTITSLAAHTVFSLIGALLIAIYFLPLAAAPAGLHLELIRWLAPLLLLMAHPHVIALTLRLLGRVTRRHIAAWTGSWLDGVVLVAISVVGWIITGIALFAFINALTPLPADAIMPVIGINAFSFVLGQLFFITPAGLGAKEGTTVALLVLYVSVPVAALLAVGVRLWTTFAEVLLAIGLARWRGAEPIAPAVDAGSGNR